MAKLSMYTVMNVSANDMVGVHVYDWYFDGVDDRISVSDSTSIRKQTFTAATFSKVEYKPTLWAFLFRKQSTFWAGSFSATLEVNMSTAFRIYTGSEQVFYTSADFFDYSRHLYTYTRNQSNGVMQVYKDSVLVKQETKSTGNIVYEDYTLEIPSAYDHGWKLYSENLIMLGRVLSSSDISEFYNNKNLSASDLVLYIDATYYDSSQNKYIDLSGNNNHGTPYGGVARLVAANRYFFKVTGRYSDNKVHFVVPAGFKYIVVRSDTGEVLAQGTANSITDVSFSYTGSVVLAIQSIADILPEAEEFRALKFALWAKIGGVWKDISNYVINGSVELALNATSSSAKFTLSGGKDFATWWTQNKITPFTEMEVYAGIISPYEEKIFKGFFENIKVSRSKYGKVEVTVQATDYTERLMNKIIVESFRKKPDGSKWKVGEIVKDIIDKYVPEVNADEVPDTDTEVDDVRFPYRTVSYALDQLRKLPMEGEYGFFIDPGLNLRFFKVEKGYPDYEVDDTIINDIDGEVDGTSIKTTIIIRGGISLSEDQSQKTTTTYYSLDTHFRAASFIPTNDKLGAIELYLAMVGDPIDDVRGRIVEDSSNSPRGYTVREFVIPKNRVSTTPGWVRVLIDTQVSIGARYWVVLNKTGNSSNTYRWYGASTGTHMQSTDGSTWSSTTGALAYIQYYAAPVLVTKSDTSLGITRDHLIIKPTISRDTARLLAASELRSLLKPSKQVKMRVVPDRIYWVGKWVRINSSFIEQDDYLITKVSYRFSRGRKFEFIEIDAVASEPSEEAQILMKKLQDQLYEERLKDVGIDEASILDMFEIVPEPLVVVDSVYTNRNKKVVTNPTRVSDYLYKDRTAFADRMVGIARSSYVSCS